jgi:biotin carboxylase
LRLLVTNTHTPQAYAIIRALRPHAERVVATMYGPAGLARLVSHAAHSRLVDARHVVPSPERDWQAGILARTNTEREERYFEQIHAICERERIDTIFPSHDPDVYVLAKNKERLAERGIQLPIPPFETLAVSLDKGRTVALAERVGFPAPKTFAPRSEEELAAIAREIPPPWVIKPRVTTASKGMSIVTRYDDLVGGMRRISAEYRDPLVQEYIPGGQKQNFYVMVGADGAVSHVFCPRIVRHSRRLYRDSSAACVALDDHPALPLVRRLVDGLGWRGALTVQTKLDPRDGTLKLMEINPRLGSHLWYRTELGINEPLHCVRIERGEPAPENADWERGTLLLEPIEDAIGFCAELLDLTVYTARVRLLRKRPTDPTNVPPGVRALVRRYAADYRGARPRKFSPHFAYFLSDLPSNLLYSLYAARYAPGGLKRMGK